MNTTVLIIASLLGCFGGLALLGSAGYGLFAFFKQPAVAGAPTPAEISLHKTGRNLLIVAVVLFLMTCCCLPLATFGANLLFGDNNTSPNSGYNAGSQPICNGNIYAIDPKNPSALGLTAPAGSIVLIETVNHTAMTITLEVRQLATPMTAYTTGDVDVNLWYGYCTLSAANEAAITQKAERDSDTWAVGYTVTIVGNSLSSPTSCTESIVPVQPNAYTPSNVYVVVETVNYSAKTVTIQALYTNQPIQASIVGTTHVNIWYGYCDLQSAQNGALTEKAERESESKIVGGWAYGFSVVLLK